MSVTSSNNLRHGVRYYVAPERWSVAGVPLRSPDLLRQGTIYVELRDKTGRFPCSRLPTPKVDEYLC